jgi:DNA primase
MSDTVALVKEKWDIVREIQKVVQLSKRGQNYVGLCPFHSEKSPSFYVSPVKKIFHCFGCGENGDVIAFVMKHDHLSFKEVMIEKATEFNIPHSFAMTAESHSDLDKLRQFLTLLQTAYGGWGTAFDAMANYLKARHIQASHSQRFGLGYAPGSSIQMAWLKTIDSLSVGEVSGLFKSDGYPLLQDRLIFPIHNARGIIVGFSGRALGDIASAKYINSPESPIFSKKKLLYGLHLAKSAIKKAESTVVVEGYMDVIAMHQHGIQNVVGVMGTALTDAHAKALMQYASTVVLLFDSDEAGQAAITKSLPALLAQGVTVKIATLPDKDPADFFESHSADDMVVLLAKALHYMDFYMAKCQSGDTLTDPTKKSKAVGFLCHLLGHETDPIVKDQYIKIMADSFGVSSNIIHSQAQSKGGAGHVKRPSLTTSSKYKKAEDVVIYLLITNVSYRGECLDEVREFLPLLSSNGVYELFKTSSLVDYELVNQIEHSEIKGFLISLIIKFTESNISFTKKEMEDHTKILKQAKLKQRIEDIRLLLGTTQGNNEKELLIELSDLIKKIK